MRPSQWLRGICGLALVLALQLAAADNGPQAPVHSSPPPAAPAQNLPAAPALSREQIASKIQAVEASETMDPTVKTRVLDLYQQADAALHAAELAQAKTRTYRAALEAPPTSGAATEAAPPAPPATAADLGLPPDAPLEVIERQLTKAQSDQAALASALAAVERTIAAQRERPKQARAELEDKRQRARALEADLASPLSGGEDALALAEHDAREARLEATTADIELLNQELLSYDVRYQALVAEQDRSKRELAAQQAKVQRLSGMLIERRKAEASITREQAEQTRIEAAGEHPAVVELAERNAELTQRLNDLVSDEARLLSASNDVKQRAEALEEDLQRFQQRLEIAGLNRVLGKLFLERRKQLSEPVENEGYDVGLEQRIVDAGLGQLQAAEERADLHDLDRALARLMEKSGARHLPPARRDLVASQLRELLTARVELLKKLESAYATRSRGLGELEFGLRRLEQVSQRFRDFLDENLLWIPNLGPIGPSALTVLGPALAVLGAPETWRPVLAQLGRDAPAAPALYAFALALLVLLLQSRRRLRRHMAEINQRVGHLHSDSFANTLRCTLIALALAVPWPCTLLFLGWRLAGTGAATSSVGRVAELLLTIGGALLPLLAMRRICDRGGLAEVHFRWTARATGIVRRELRLFSWVLIPAIVLGGRGPWLDEDLRATMGRSALLVVASMLAFTVYRLLNPTRGAIADKLRAVPRSTLTRTRWLWMPPLLGTPVVLVLLAALGYQFTAAELTRNYYVTLWLIALAYLVHEYGVRWLELTGAKVSWRKAVEARRAQAARDGSQPETEGAEDPALINFESVNIQSLRLFSTVIVIVLAVVLWRIWSDLLPALGILNDVQLWAYDEQVAGESVVRHITLGNLAFALALAFLFAIATPSVPRLLELVVLQRFAFTAGTLNAITSICRYVIVAVGVIVVFNTLGVGWSKVQWLVAAVSVGLGFGLQEIFANFVSGLIILFERPVRIGDMVTVAEVSGTVTRIRIRATTIRDWDNKEHVVPNKTLITSELTNWSLSDAILRVVLHVGIAYGSDTRRAHQIMLDLARELPQVLEQPAPTVYFMGLGESSLDFVIRLFIPDVTELFKVQHDYYMAVERRLREAGIEIPFPQRDVHIRSTPEG